jgi:hypothetical protein
MVPEAVLDETILLISSLEPEQVEDEGYEGGICAGGCAIDC